MESLPPTMYTKIAVYKTLMSMTRGILRQEILVQIIATFKVVGTSRIYSKSSFRYLSRTTRSYNTMAPDTTLSPRLMTSLIEELEMCGVFHLFLAILW